MATYVLCPLSTFMQVLNSAANTVTPLSGGLIWTYAAGTTTPTPTYTDSTGGTPNSNPIQLNSAGQLLNVNIYQPAGTKIKVLFSTNAGTVAVPVLGTQIGPTFDNIVGIGDTVVGQNTYYGGTDTGSVNAYILNFSATFTAYTNGLIIYWVPNNTNTGASTININGLGIIAIQNANGSALLPNQLIANQVAAIAIQGGVAVLLISGNSASNLTGTFTGTLTGMTSVTTGTFNYAVASNTVTLYLNSTVSATSNTTAMSITGLPAVIQPSKSTTTTCLKVIDNGVPYLASAVINGSTVGFFKLLVSGSNIVDGGTFTNSGTKGLSIGWVITYPLL